MMRLLTFIMILIVSSTLFSQNISKSDLKKITTDCSYQYAGMIAELVGANAFPKSYNKSSYTLVTSRSNLWSSGYYSGSLLYLFELTSNRSFLKEANRLLASLNKEQFSTMNHDLGLMMNSSFGNAYRLLPNAEYKKAIINSAKSFSTRYSAKVGALRSSDKNPTVFTVGIDNINDSELLFRAAQLSGDSSFYRIAVANANTIMKSHFRQNGSCWQMVDFDIKTGEIMKRRNEKGLDDMSSWSRAQAWGLYGFTMLYRETKQKKYLHHATNIYRFIFTHPNLPKDKIPYWDFDAPNIPYAPRDASAAAIMCSALLELHKYVEPTLAIEYKKMAVQLFKTLSSSKYRVEKGTTGGFILDHCVGDFPAKSEVDVPTICGDYFYIESLKRINSLVNGE